VVQFAEFGCGFGDAVHVLEDGWDRQCGMQAGGHVGEGDLYSGQEHELSLLPNVPVVLRAVNMLVVMAEHGDDTSLTTR
jgi:hypothetical protein